MAKKETSKKVLDAGSEDGLEVNEEEIAETEESLELEEELEELGED